MNLSSSFEKMKTKQYHLTAKQRLLAVVAIGITAIIITIYATTSEVTVQSIAPDNNSIQQTANPPSRAVMPIGNQVMQVNQVAQTMRDPFALAPDAKEQKNDIDRGSPSVQNNIPDNNKNNVPTNVSNNVPAIAPRTIVPSASLRLTGIVGNEEGRLAVIMSADKSQSYSVNDRIGTYKIVAIHDDSVILTNATGQLVLRFEATRQKGDNSSAK